MTVRDPSGRWGTVAAEVMRRPGLSVAAKAVYAALATYADRNGWMWVRQESIAADLERSRAWVHAAIAELEMQGLLRHDRQYLEGRQRASRYRLLDGLSRCAARPAETSAEGASPSVSDDCDSGVQPADTKHHEGLNDSLSNRVRESGPVKCREGADSGEVPADWVPTSVDVAWAKARLPNLDVQAFTEGFVLSCRAKGYRYADVSAAWRRWLLEPKASLPLLVSQHSCRSQDQEDPHGSHPQKPDSAAHRQSGRSHPFQPAGGGATGRGPDPKLTDHNRERAAACLDRILGRRSASPHAGHTG
jgi:hypothetical protein